MDRRRLERGRLDDEGPVVEEFDLDAVDFLTGFVTGAVRSRVLDPVGFEQPTDTAGVRPFEPVVQGEWEDYSNVPPRGPGVRKISLRGGDLQ